MKFHSNWYFIDVSKQKCIYNTLIFVEPIYKFPLLMKMTVLIQRALYMVLVYYLNTKVNYSLQ